MSQNGGGTSAGFFDGESGSFDILPTDKTGRDHRGKGLLEYVGEHHLRFAENGEWFLKAGADSPENLLAYEDFDNTANNGNRRKSFSSHEQDYQAGDPTWSGGIGTEIIGAINYLAEKGMNVFSFLPMNIEGDDKNVFPYISDSEGDDRLRFDVSKLAQWEILFEHADRIGMYLHFKTQETENDQLLDGGQLGNERKLYYRELIARFGHHLALNWNIGEENTNTDAQRKAFADFFNENDPYKHVIVVHTYTNQKSKVYPDLLGYPAYGGVSVQSNAGKVFSDTLDWREKSAAAGHKWVVANDEQGPYTAGVVPDADDASHDLIRKQVLWGNIMAGGAGVEYYFGYQFAHSDLTLQDFRSRDKMWDLSRYALQFFSRNRIPFWDMSNDNGRLSNDNWCLSQSNDDVIVVYLINGGSDSIDLAGETGETYSIQWYDPRNGGDLQAGSLSSLQIGSGRDLGTAPGSNEKDWVVLLQRAAPEPTKPATEPPTKKPTRPPTKHPTEPPTKKPTPAPTDSPTKTPTPEPISPPTMKPTLSPTPVPTKKATQFPTSGPTASPVSASHDEAAADLLLDNVEIVPVDGTQTPGKGWTDSYSVGDRCYCDSSNCDHGIGSVVVRTPCGDMTVIEACN